MGLPIEYTAAGGTVLLGTAKGDGAAEELRAARCRWRSVAQYRPRRGVVLLPWDQQRPLARRPSTHC